MSSILLTSIISDSASPCDNCLSKLGMMHIGLQKPILFLSIPLTLCIAIASVYGLLHPDFYLRETPNWALQSWGQDVIDLALISPVLFFSSILAYRGKRMAMLKKGLTSCALIVKKPNEFARRTS